MRKVVFKGVINGETFDNVLDYNKKMTELIEAGKSVSASSSTTIVDGEDLAKVEDTKEINEKCENVKNKDEKEAGPEYKPEDFFPYFHEKDDYYLDELVDKDDKENQNIHDCVENTLCELFDVFTDVSDKFDVDELISILTRAKDIKKAIAADRQKNEKLIRDLSGKLDIAVKAGNIIDLMESYYEAVYDHVREGLLSY